MSSHYDKLAIQLVRIIRHAAEESQPAADSELDMRVSVETELTIWIKDLVRSIQSNVI